MTRAPATANEAMSTENRRSTTSPAKKNPSNRPVEMEVACSALTGRPLVFKSMIMGVEPSTSSTANSTMNALTISWTFKRPKMYAKSIRLIFLDGL